MGRLPMRFRRSFLFFLLTSLPAVLAIVPAGTAERVTIVVLATTDLHGAIYPLDYYADRPRRWGWRASRRWWKKNAASTRTPC